MVLDLLLMVSLGFLGSFGHCASMCGPLAVAFSVSVGPTTAAPRSTLASSLRFHGLLNLGRISSYALVGMALGAVGELLVAGGQIVGVGSELRQAMAIATGLLLLGLGLKQVAPRWVSLGSGEGVSLGWGRRYHDRLSRLLVSLSLREYRWTPFLLGLCWGLIPCGFLYIAQIRAAETGHWWQGGLMMLAFGLGTLPTMLGLGWIASRWSRDRRDQLFRLGGWITLVTGGVLLWRSGDSHGGGLSAYGSLVLLTLALVARPLAQLSHLGRWRWLGSLLPYRRGLGVGAFILACLHAGHIVTVNWGWNWQVVNFLIARHRQGVALGLGAWLLLVPPALTSLDRYQQGWGVVWRRIHCLSLPALALAVGHTILLASSVYGLPGSSQGSPGATLLLIALAAGVGLLRGWLPPRSVAQLLQKENQNAGEKPE